MSISFSCQSCGKRYQVDESLAGKRVKCKGCEEVLSIPKPASASSGSSSSPGRPAAAKPAKARKPAPVFPAKAPAAGSDPFADLDETYGFSSNPKGPGSDPEFEVEAIPRLKSTRPGAKPSKNLGEERSTGQTVKIVIGVAAGTVFLVLLLVFVLVRSSGPDRNRNQAAAGPPPVVPAPFPAPDLAQNPMPGQEMPPEFAPNPNPAPDLGGNRPEIRPRQNPMTNEPARPGFVRNEVSKANVAPVSWRSLNDPPVEPVAPLSEKNINFNLPRGASKDNIYFSTTYSPFLGVESRRGAQSEFELWDLRTQNRQGRLAGDLRIDRQTYALDPLGMWLATKSLTSGGKSIDIYSFSEGGKAATINLDNHPDYVEFAGPDRVVIGATFQRAFEVWDLRAERQVATFSVPARPDKDSLAVSPGGRYIIMCSTEDDRLRAYDLNNGQLIGEIDLPAEGSYSAYCKGTAFSPDGEELAGLFEVSSKPIILCWNTRSGKLEAEHRFEDRNDLPNSFGYNSRAIDWLTFQDAWLVRGETVVDRQSGQKIWRFPYDLENFPAAARRMQSPDQLLSMVGSFSKGFSLRSNPIPDQLKKAIDVVRAGGNAIDATLPDLTEPDRSAVELIALTRGTPWSAQADPAEAAEQPLAARPIPLRAQGRQVQRVLFSEPKAARALVVVRVGGPIQKDDDPRRLDRYDLASGRSLGSLDLPPLLEPIAFSLDGSTVLTRDADQQSRLDVWSLDEGTIDASHVVGWRPFENDPNQVTWAAFLDAEHILTSNEGGTLVLWNLPACRAVYQVETAGAGAPLLSPGRQYLALFQGSTVSLIVAKTGELKGETVAASVAGDPTAANFSTDGSELVALLGGSQLVRWSLADGALIDQFDSPVSGQQRIQVCGADHALLDGRALIDLDRRKPVWNYFGVEPAEGTPDGRFWFVALTNNNATLNAIPLPTPEVAETIALAEAPGTAALLKPGMTISLQLDIPGPPKDSKVFLQSIADRFADRLREKGVNVVNGQEVKLLVSAREADTGETMELRSMIPRPGESPLATQSMPIKKIEYEVTLIDRQGRVPVLPKQTVNMASFGIFRIPPGEDAATHIRQGLWENARDRMTGGAVPEFVARQRNQVVTLPGSTDLSRPTR